MRAKPLYKDRYPGLQPFDKGQSTIFFGRDQEKKELYYQICLEKMVVLFGKSGLGKSSLLNAGVSPLLERNGYLPIRIRFTSGTQASTAADSENLLIRDFILAFEGFRFKRKILYNKEDPQLWEYIKATPFIEQVKDEVNTDLSAFIMNKKSQAETEQRELQKLSVTPVFIFDQFEEFFNHPVRHQQEFLSQLSEAVHDETPQRILEWITRKEPEERTAEQIEWHQQPAIKVVFALRSDKLANMQSLVSYIPTALRNRYELKALTPAQAEQAIKGPAAKTDLGPEYIPPFSFDETTLAEIVHELSGDSNEIESSQLQIVCNFIEQRVRAQSSVKSSGESIVVNSSIISPARDFPLILDNFYDTQLEKIADPKNREMARKLIEDDLVIDGQRDSISKRKLNNTLNISDNLIDEILITRLIREEPTSRGPIYELSHDTLIAPVEKSKNRRLKILEDQKKEEERIALAQEAKKKDEELKERYRQLATEIQLREEAQTQKNEVERLARKVKSRGKWVILLLLVLSITLVVIFWFEQSYTDRQLKKTRLQLKGKDVNTAIKFTADSMMTKDTGITRDSIKATVLNLIDNADSIAQFTDDKKDPIIDSLIDNYYKDDFKKRNIKINELTTTEKIETLKKILPRYEQFKIKSDFQNKRMPAQYEKNY